MHKTLSLIFTTFLFFSTFSQVYSSQDSKELQPQTPIYLNSWEQIHQNIHLIDSLCNKPYRSGMNLNTKKMRVMEKSTSNDKCRQKTKVYNRRGIIYSKTTYKLDSDKKIKVLTINEEIAMIKFKYKWYNEKVNRGVYDSRTKVRFMRTGKQWLYTNKIKNKLIDDKDRNRHQKTVLKEYVTLEE